MKIIRYDGLRFLQQAGASSWKQFLEYLGSAGPELAQLVRKVKEWVAMTHYRHLRIPRTLVGVAGVLAVLLFSPVGLTAGIPLQGAELRYAAATSPVLPDDAALGRISEPAAESWEYELKQILEQFFLQPAGSSPDEGFLTLVSGDTRLMFQVMHQDGLLGILPADSFYIGRIVETDGMARIPVRIFLNASLAASRAMPSAISGEVFASETLEGWRIVSAVFDFSPAGD